VIDDRALLIEYRALLIEYRALLIRIQGSVDSNIYIGLLW